MKVTKENLKQLESAIKAFYAENEVDVEFNKIIQKAKEKGYIDVWEYQREKETNDEYAYRQLKLICQVYNDGWEPNLNDNSEKKYYPWFSVSSGFAFDYTYYGYGGATMDTGSRLCFKNRELAEFAGRTFTEIYKKYLLK